MPSDRETTPAPAVTWECERCGATWDNRGDVAPCERLHDEPARCQIVEVRDGKQP